MLIKTTTVRRPVGGGVWTRIDLDATDMCCESMKQLLAITTLTWENGQFVMSIAEENIHGDLGDYYPIPLHYCPSCGEPILKDE